MSRSALSGVPGYLTVSGAGQVLHLAPRSIRDLIYAGRLASVRLGRRHFLSAADIDAERRRRLGLPVRRSRPKQPGVTSEARLRRVADPEARRRRAEERALLLERWRRAAGPATPAEAGLPFAWHTASGRLACTTCGSQVAAGEQVLSAAWNAASGWLCAGCGRRALLGWADQRTQQAAAARRLARAVAPPLSSRAELAA